MKKLSALFLFSIFIFTACGQQSVKTQNISNENTAATQKTTPAETAQTEETKCRICDYDLKSYKGELKKEEVEGLLLALNDEFMAMATYQRINKDFNNPRPFVNIVEAEKRHADRLRTLFETYKLPVPENPWPGNVPAFKSVSEACQAGVAAEIANRDLYTKLFDSTKREDILIVYRALQSASENNHLPAFQRCGNGQGGNGQGRQRRGNF